MSKTINKPKTMNEPVEARFIDHKNGLNIRMYRHSEGKTGIFVVDTATTKIFDISMEAFFYTLSKKEGYELVEMTTQVRERELGNADEAYEVTWFDGGKVVYHK